MLVVLNNGRVAMPPPVRIQLAANGNIPPRFRGFLAGGRILQSQIEGVADALVSNGDVDVRFGAALKKK